MIEALTQASVPFSPVSSAAPVPRPPRRPLSVVRTDATHAVARLPPRPGRGATIALVVLVHAVVLGALWAGQVRHAPPKKPAVVEVALIEPERPKPPPPPPPPPPLKPPAIVPKVVAPRPPVLLPPPPMAPMTALPVLVPPPTAIQVAIADVEPVRPGPTVVAPPTPAPPPPGPAPVVVPPRFDAAYLDNPAPIYPSLAKRRGEEGRVLLRVQVSAEGRADRVEVSKTSGSPILDEAAIEAVRRWRFVPARRGSDAIAAPVLVPIAFALTR